MKRTSKVLLLFCCLIFLAIFADAQTKKSFKGVVLDTTGAPLSGATISFKGSKIFTTTDENGIFNALCGCN